MNFLPVWADGQNSQATTGGTSLGYLSRIFHDQRGTKFADNPLSLKGLVSNNGTITANLTAALPGLISGSLTQFPPQASLSPISFGSMNEGAMVLGYMQKAGIKFNGSIVEDAEYFTSNLAASDLLATEVLDPKNVAFNARAGQLASLIQIGNVFGSLSLSQSHSALDAVGSVMKNFTADGGNVWNKLRDQIFVPMAILLLLPGAVLTQVKAMVDTTRGDYSDPWAGILRSIVATFLIPASYLVVNYGIDLSNSMTSSLQNAYQSVTGRNLSEDVLAKEAKAFPVRTPMENQHAGLTPNLGWNVGKIDNLADLEHQLIENQPGVNGNGGSAAAKTDDAMPISAATLRMGAFGANFGLTAVWNLLTAFQFAFLAFLFLMGPVVCALWVYPIEFLQRGLSSWVEGAITLCFWTFFWHTGLIVVACLPDNGATGTIAMTVGNFLMVSCVKYAFDFSGLVRAAASEASSQMLKELESGGASEKNGGGKANGKAAAKDNAAAKHALEGKLPADNHGKTNSQLDPLGKGLNTGNRHVQVDESGNIISPSNTGNSNGLQFLPAGLTGDTNLLGLTRTDGGSQALFSPKDIDLPPLANTFTPGDSQKLGSVTGFSLPNGNSFSALTDGDGLQLFDSNGKLFGSQLNGSIQSVILPGGDSFTWNSAASQLSYVKQAGDLTNFQLDQTQQPFSNIISAGQLDLGGPFAISRDGISVLGIGLNPQENGKLNFQLGENVVFASLTGGNLTAILNSSAFENSSLQVTRDPLSSGFMSESVSNLGLSNPVSSQDAALNGPFTATVTNGNDTITSRIDPTVFGSAVTQTFTGKDGQQASVSMTLAPEGAPTITGGGVSQPAPINGTDAQSQVGASSLPGAEPCVTAQGVIPGYINDGSNETPKLMPTVPSYDTSVVASAGASSAGVLETRSGWNGELVRNTSSGEFTLPVSSQTLSSTQVDTVIASGASVPAVPYENGTMQPPAVSANVFSLPAPPAPPAQYDTGYVVQPAASEYSVFSAAGGPSGSINSYATTDPPVVSNNGLIFSAQVGPGQPIDSASASAVIAQADPPVVYNNGPTYSAQTPELVLNPVIAQADPAVVYNNGPTSSAQTPELVPNAVSAESWMPVVPYDNGVTSSYARSVSSEQTQPSTTQALVPSSEQKESAQLTPSMPQPFGGESRVFDAITTQRTDVAPILASPQPSEMPAFAEPTHYQTHAAGEAPQYSHTLGPSLTSLFAGIASAAGSVRPVSTGHSSSSGSEPLIHAQVSAPPSNDGSDYSGSTSRTATTSNTSASKRSGPLADQFFKQADWKCPKCKKVDKYGKCRACENPVSAIV